MGTEVRATCECGLNEKILIGGGMSNFKTFCAFPCYCKDCESIVQANVLAEKMSCDKCASTNLILYDNPTLLGELGDSEIVTWNQTDTYGRFLTLHSGYYLCPECQKKTLTFQHTGLMWD